MAVYKYFCKDCDYYFEINKSINKIDEEEKCSRCAAKVERLFSASSGAVIFVGPGFHKNDYKKVESNAK